MMASVLRPRWAREVNWLWTDDKNFPIAGSNTIYFNFLRLFREVLPNDLNDWQASHDCGTEKFFLRRDGVVVRWSYHGNNAIGVVKGPSFILTSTSIHTRS